MEKTEKRLSDKIRDARPLSLYIETAKKFNTSYIYVTQIASGIRSGSRGKGKLVKEYLEEQIKNK